MRCADCQRAYSRWEREQSGYGPFRGGSWPPSPQNTAYPVQQLVTTQTETPDAVVLPADIPALDETVKPGAREEEKKSTSPCDCEDCIAFYAIYQ